MNSSQDKVLKERSPLYPIFSINEVFDFVSEIAKLGGKKVSVETVASSVGMSVKTNSFKSKISTAKQFGLLRGSDGAVELTDLAKSIIYPVDEAAAQRARIESFLSAPLYQKLAERFENKAVPSFDKLGNILLLEYGLTKGAKDLASKKFIESAEQIGVLKNGIILLEADEFSTVDSEALVESSSDEKIEGSLGSSALSEERCYRFTIPTLSGSAAQIIIPHDVSVKDLDFITLYIQNMLPTFISNLKEEIE